MVLYWSIFILIVLFSFLEQTCVISKKNAKTIFIFMVLVLYCLSFMRWERGTDWQAYYSFFLDGGERRTYDEHTEPGYLLFNRIVAFFTDSYTVFLACWSGVYYFLYVLLANKINGLFKGKTLRRCYMPLLLFDFSQGFAGMFAVRSTMAYLICFLAFFYIYEKKPLKFIIALLLATSLHVSSAIFILAYPLYRMQLNKISIAAIIIVTFLLFSLGAYYEPILKALNFGGYDEYLGGEERRSVLGSLKWVFAFLALFAFRPMGKNELYGGIVNIVLVGIILFLWSQLYSPVAQRLSLVFTQCILRWLAMVFYGYGEKKRILFLLVIVAFCGVSLWSTLNSDYKGLYIPYKFFWDTFPVEVY